MQGIPMLSTPTGRERKEEARRTEREEEEKSEIEKEEEERGGEEEEEAWKVSYQNIGRGIETTNILLERGRGEKTDFIFLAEAWEGRKGERTTQAGYRIFAKLGSQLVLYIKEEVDITALGNIQLNDKWISIGNLVTGVYLSPNLTINSLREYLLDIPSTDNLIGDFNYTQRHKRRTLLEIATA